MKSIVPYTKEIVFDSKIAEICSISLEHEIDYRGSEIEGNFIVSGEFRSHEVSVNKEPFSYKLPFSVDVTDNVIRDSVEFEITDFTYDIVNENTLKIDIEFMVSAEEVEETSEEVEDVVEEEREELEDKNTEETREAVMEEINSLFGEKEEELQEDVSEERLDEESESLILNTVGETDNEFTTYHIHIVSESDTIESICAMYETDTNTIKAYNSVDTITAGDKIIIPSIDE